MLVCESICVSVCEPPLLVNLQITLSYPPLISTSPLAPSLDPLLASPPDPLLAPFLASLLATLLAPLLSSLLALLLAPLLTPLLALLLASHLAPLLIACQASVPSRWVFESIPYDHQPTHTDKRTTISTCIYAVVSLTFVPKHSLFSRCPGFQKDFFIVLLIPALAEQTPCSVQLSSEYLHLSSVLLHRCH